MKVKDRILNNLDDVGFPLWWWAIALIMVGYMLVERYIFPQDNLNIGFFVLWISLFVVALCDWYLTRRNKREIVKTD